MIRKGGKQGTVDIPRDKLVIERIEYGTVIDRLTDGTARYIVSMLHEKYPGVEIATATHVRSTTLGFKDIIKIIGIELSEEDTNLMAMIHLLAPEAKVNIIQGFEVRNKITPALSEDVTKYLRCNEPNCITNHVSEPEPEFSVLEEVLTCKYCDRSFQPSQIPDHLRV